MIKSDINSGKYISRKQAVGLQNLLLKEGWILITCSGTLGNVIYTNRLFKERIATHDIIRVIPKNKDIKEGFLYAYLSSKYGYALITQSSYGGVVKHIEPHHIANLPVPIFPSEKQQKIHELITQSSELRVEAGELIEEATNNFQHYNKLIFERNLLGVFEKETKNTFIVNRSDFITSSLKARNYSYRAKQLMQIFETHEGSYLEKYLAEPFQMGVRASFKRIAAANFKGHDIISQGDIHKQNPKIFKQVKIKKNNLKGRAQRATIIMPSAGTLGENEVFTRPLLVRNNFEGKLLSEVIGVFNCRTEEDAAYLYIFLNLKASFRILRAMVYGTNLLYPNWELLKKIKVPICKEPGRSEISKKVIKAFDLRAEANIKENQAIKLVEKEIEQWQQ
jgi:restriction endonuclease S subunit